MAGIILVSIFMSSEAKKSCALDLEVPRACGCHGVGSQDAWGWVMGCGAEPGVYLSSCLRMCTPKIKH